MKNAIVIGGGLAGIAAAMALAKHGTKVQLLEARRRLGGRTGSFVASESNDAIDYCQHVGMGCCTNLRQLIDWMGQEESWETHRSLHFYGPDGSYQRLSALPALPAPLHLAGWLLRWPGLKMGDRISVVRGMLAIRSLAINRGTDSASALTWLVENRQTKTAIEHFWRTIIVSALGEELEKVNLSSVAKVLQDGFLNHRDAFHLIVPKRPLGELFGTQSEQKLREIGVEVHLQSRVKRIAQISESLFQVESDAHGTLTADAIVVAVPWFRVQSLFESTRHGHLQQIARDAERLTSSPISGIHTWWDRAWLDTPHAAIVGRLSQWVFPKHDYASSSAIEDNEHYYQIVISASRRLPRGDTSTLMQMLKEDLAAVFPKASTANLLRMQVVTDPQAVYSVGIDSSLLRPTTSVAGTNVWLAGDWIQTGWPATMEGAIRSGWIAAENILAAWGNSTQIVAPSLSRFS